MRAMSLRSRLTATIDFLGATVAPVSHVDAVSVSGLSLLPSGSIAKRSQPPSDCSLVNTIDPFDRGSSILAVPSEAKDPTGWVTPGSPQLAIETIRSGRRLRERSILERHTLRVRGTFPAVLPAWLLGLAERARGSLGGAIHLRLDRGDGGTRTRDFLLAKHAPHEALTWGFANVAGQRWEGRDSG